jgi:hypothetical protein
LPRWSSKVEGFGRYADIDIAVADLRAAGLHCTVAEPVTLEGHANSAADVDAGYCQGTPVCGEIEVRGDFETNLAIVLVATPTS